MTLHEKADKLLSVREDLYEMHFHQVDREWLIEAMVDFSMQLPKKELSDEEIEKAAFDYVENSEEDKWTATLTFIAGCKWYREQLKNK